MTIVLFEDEALAPLAPICLVRPAFELRCGIFSLRERVKAFVAAHQLPDQVEALCRPYLMPCFGVGGGFAALLQQGEPVILINARALDLAWLPELLSAPIESALVAGSTLLGARLSPRLASIVLYDLQFQRSHAALAELRRFARLSEYRGSHERLLISYPWDLINQNGAQICADVALLPADLPRLAPTEHGPLIVRGEQCFVHPQAILAGPLVLDSRTGPIIIAADAQIEPFSFIQGPCAIGSGTLIASARIRGETSFGPVCRIGGEVEASVVQGFSNKHHDGFLGHSWLGEWVNIGAMTTNSDLKNTYGAIRVSIEGLGQLDSGTIKLGCFLADHVKLGIGLHLSGGTVIGTGSNLFGAHSAPKTVPAFMWGDTQFREYRIEGMISVAKKVMARRKRELTPAYEALLHAAFAMTRHSRDLGAPPAPPRERLKAEQALALAEAATLVA